ncbi:hypothetical protein BDQ12DRAFT_686552 [Crucibulum laeve]|uniref:Uncharacterized protein n=1 Tax=Crucibulum laeve TaxID=68775 RepID=A0A5C3LTJ1_9AGAR|nr:hypothetical protein BDQ12DRAFT_686552 [Crucibulum laeve]
MKLSTSILPPALLDLTLLRVSSPSNGLITRLRAAGANMRRISTTRQLKQPALAEATPPPAPYIGFTQAMNSHAPEAEDVVSGKRPLRRHRSLTVRSGSGLSSAASELQRRIEALSTVVIAEENTADASLYTEEELLTFYEGVLDFTAPEEQNADTEAPKLAQAERDISLINGVDRRLMDPELLANARSTQSFTSEEYNEADVDLMQPYRRVLKRAHEIVTRVEAVRNSMDKTADLETLIQEQPSSSKKPFLAVGVLSPLECEALVRVCIQARDTVAAELALELMKRTGTPVPEVAITDLLEMYCESANVTAVESLLQKYLSGPPTEPQRHLHIKTHLRASPPSSLPTTALSVLHSYEDSGTPAPLKTYTTLIASLFSTPSTTARAHAWDLFYHMRYAAHPDPDVILYTQMIRACASPISVRFSSEPERALDLWTEMTVDHRIVPTRGAYNAVILACARSGEKQYVNEAFRLARQMLDSHRDARGKAAYRPDRGTFCALLEGAKRIGDLGRVRWILAEMIRGGEDGLSVDENVMVHVFHAYASYRPPFERSMAKLIKEEGKEAGAAKPGPQSPAVQPESAMQMGSSENRVAVDTPNPTLTHLPPQTHQEVINEVKFLFKRILDDTGYAKPSDDLPLPSNTFNQVAITNYLVSAFLSVYYRHSSLQNARGLFWSLYEDLKLERNAHAYVQALETCANARRVDRETAMKFAEEVWVKWSVLEENGMDGRRKLDARMIERANLAMIKTLSLRNEVERAMDHVRAFAARYPPNDIRTPTPKPALRASKTALTGARPLVRMTSTEVPDDKVPPLLTFPDLEVLHHRLVVYEKTKDIGYIKWLTSTYEWVLRMRRNEAMKARPPKADLVPVVV